ncbi:MAG: DEAD/DEAH box helicase family protein [Deltaproteobacteria bacterium]|nr:DEAD/DEAH box helicase family protein [Deltaproteobacteria bacterium]
MSVFLDRPARDHVARNALAFAIRDGFPVSPGHTLVIPFREVATWFDATREEQLAILELIDVVKAQLDAEFAPAGYNVGFNAGAAAGQTVMHLHVHVIPRFEGDVADPRGGVRHVMPGKGNYLAGDFKAAEQATPRRDALTTGGKHDGLLRVLGPELRDASALDVIAAFVQQSGLQALEAALATMAPGARLRLITGDYLGITQADALATLLDWQRGVSPVAAAQPIDGPGAVVEVRVVETAKLPTSSRSFHPKAWLVEHGAARAIGWVGSSNLSRAALTDAVEWNLRLDRAADLPAWLRLRQAFDALWATARQLDAELVADYRERVHVAVTTKKPPLDDVPGEVEQEGGSLPMPEPHEVQREALAALAQARAEARGRALAVMATGLGKTWLAAFDVAALAARLGRTPRLLFLAHRVELLVQAARTFRVMAQHAGLQGVQIGMFVGGEDALDADFVFASVQKLGRGPALDRLKDHRWDYVVVDEVHHATAKSYRDILDDLEADFILGLTATPDRADAADVAGIFDDHVAVRADLARGIGLGLLVPIAYHGLCDPVDYAPIPWRNGQFDADALARAVATQQRMEKVWQAWQAHPGERTLVFCCSIAHADFVGRWLRERGVACATLHSGPESHDRGLALDAFADGKLAALVTVDLLNEGVDVPSVDRVVFLRPSDSPVVFLQQLGRGLRRAEGKRAVTVLDLVGNHAVFLRRMQTLRDALPVDPHDVASMAAWLTAARMADGTVAMPAGCTMSLELEAIDLLRALASVGKDNPGAQRFRELWQASGRRPTAAEMYRLGFNPKLLGGKGRGFLEFAADEGALDDDERAALASGGGAFVRELERTPMSKCFKMVALQALVEADALHGAGDAPAGLPVPELARRSWRLLLRSPELRRDLFGVKELGAPCDEGALNAVEVAKFARYWRGNPVAAWAGESAKKSKVRPQFRVEVRDGVEWLVPRFEVAVEVRAAFEALVVELVAWRLAEYRGRRRLVDADDGVAEIVCKVLRNDRHPILKLPDRAKNPGMPEGEVEVTLPDGARWVFRFAKEFVNVAYPVGETANRLGELLVGWFGVDAGGSGTAFVVRFGRGADGWAVAPPANGYRGEFPAVGTLVDVDSMRADRIALLLLDASGLLVSPTVTSPIESQPPGASSALAVAKDDEGHWRSLGAVSRQRDGGWAIDEVDFDTWRRLGPVGTRSASRALPGDAESRAKAVVEALLVEPGVGGWVGRDGKRCRIVGRSAKGGVRIDGGDGGFGERTVSLTDLGWALLARDVASREGSVLDEALVNRLRYLRGTPVGSTRWVDGGWALLLGVGDSLGSNQRIP